MLVQIDRSEPQEQKEESPVARNLVSKLKLRFDEWSQARTDIEKDWIEDLRAFSALYDSTTQAALDSDPNRSQIYVRLTREKTMAAYGRIIDLLFPNGSDHPWSVSPTPIPDLFDGPTESEMKQQAIMEVMQLMQQMEQQGTPIQELPADLVEARVKEILDGMKEDLKKEAKVRSERMQEKIKDQLLEAKYESVYKSSIMEACIVGTGAIKGATVRMDKTQRWMQDETGAWVTSSKETPKPNVEHVSIFDLYPDPHSKALDSFSGIFHRHVMTKHQFRKLKTTDGFLSDAISNTISRNPDGNHLELHHELERRQIAGHNLSHSSDRYEVLEFWGLVDGHDLITAGLEVEDPEVEYEANVWFSDNEVIRARLNPISAQSTPYHLFPYERTPHQLWGIGVPKMMRDSQATINAAVRIFIDNQAISSGPQVEVNTSMIAPGSDVTDIHPWKIWLREGGDAGTPMLRFYQPQNVSAHLTTVIELFRRFADEETSMPSYSHGQHTPGMTKTASGMSMLMGAASIAMKSVIKNIDDYATTPLITSMYHWNMRWCVDESIKGDMDIVAAGSTALIAKEVRSQRLIQFMQMTANPVDIRLTERRELIKEVAKSLDLDPDKMVPEMSEQDEAQQKEEGAKEIQKQEAAYEMEMQRVQAQTAKAQAQAQQAMADSQRSMVDAQTLPMEREAEAARDFAYAEQTRQDIQLGKSPTGFDQ